MFIVILQTFRWRLIALQFGAERLWHTCRQNISNRHLRRWQTGCLTTSTTASPTWSTTLSRLGLTAGCGHPTHGRHIVRPCERTTTLKGGTTGWISVAATATSICVNWCLCCTPSAVRDSTSCTCLRTAPASVSAAGDEEDAGAYCHQLGTVCDWCANDVQSA